jgi:hypothetical protein
MPAAYLVYDAKPVGAWLARDSRASVYPAGANPKNACIKRKSVHGDPRITRAQAGEHRHDHVRPIRRHFQAPFIAS